MRSDPIALFLFLAFLIFGLEEIRLHCKSRSFILYAPSDELRREWIDDIRASIAGTHKEELASKEVKKKVIIVFELNGAYAARATSC